MASLSQDSWRNFPRYMIMTMIFVAIVNARFIMIAVATFPGAATNDDFDTSNRYNAVMESAARQDALGWTERLTLQGPLPALDLTDRSQTPLRGATVTASAMRPLGTAPAVNVVFHEVLPGHYVADAALPQTGQYDLSLRITRGDNRVRVTRRLIAP